ncbi:MAG: hypothetical protein KJ645_07355, partial [Planctomycetes bacterium]|nr:hypothetical protein [Planctomycetota bacterium]
MVEIAGGYESDAIELTLAVGNGDTGNRPYVWVGNFTCSPMKNMDAGVFNASDLGESVEVQNLSDDFQDFQAATGAGFAPESSTVPGAGGFVALTEDRYTVDFEYIAAMDSFTRGFLENNGRRPWAWNFEATFRPTPPWEVGARVERSDSLPDSPEF